MSRYFWIFYRKLPNETIPTKRFLLMRPPPLSPWSYSEDTNYGNIGIFFSENLEDFFANWNFFSQIEKHFLNLEDFLIKRLTWHESIPPSIVPAQNAVWLTIPLYEFFELQTIRGTTDTLPSISSVECGPRSSLFATEKKEKTLILIFVIFILKFILTVHPIRLKTEKTELEMFKNFVNKIFFVKEIEFSLKIMVVRIRKQKKHQ